MRARRYTGRPGRARTGVCVCFSVILGFLAASASAGAVRGHTFQKAFGVPCSTPPCAAGQLDEPSGLAIDEAAQVVYVVDKGDQRVEWFNATTGAFEGQFNGSNEFEVKGIKKVDATTPPLPLAAPEGIAVDNDLASESFGDVYVEDPSQGVIDKFNAEGEYITQISETEPERHFLVSELAGVGVNGQGELLVYQENEPEIDRYNSKSSLNEFVEGFKSEALEFPRPGFAVEPAGSDLYVVSSGRVVSKIDATGRVLDGVNKFEVPVGLDDFGRAAFGAGVLAVEGNTIGEPRADGSVYVDHGESVARFSSSGVPLETLGEAVLGAGSGVAVSLVGAGVYVADALKGVVDLFGSEEVSPPTVQGESFGEVTASSVSVGGEVNPRGANSEYRFQYGRCATADACPASGYENSVPIPSGTLPGDFEPHTVTASVEGLAANATYHFRLVAVNAKGEGAGQEKIFVTQVAGREFSMLDGRQWEMVSPPNKYGAFIRPIEGQGVVQAAASGNAVTYVASEPTEPDAQDNSAPTQVLSTRGTQGGWSSRDIAPPQYGPPVGAPVGSGLQYRAFSEDLSLAALQPFGLFPPPGAPQSLSGQATEATAFLRQDYLNGNVSELCTAGCYRPLVSGANVPPATQFGVEASGAQCTNPQELCGPQFVGGSPDLGHVVVSSQVALTATPVSGVSLYEWSRGLGSSAPLSLINVLVGEHGEETVAAPAELGSKKRAAGAVSDDGQRVVWQSDAPQHLYLRDVLRGETVQLDVAQAGGEESIEPVFQFASVDGSRVLFTDEGQLTGVSGHHDLYECEIVEGPGGLRCELHDLTPMTGGEEADVQGLLGASRDGLWVYFAANGIQGENPQAVHGTCRGTGGSNTAPPGAVCDVYVRHGGVTRLVAVVSANDISDWCRRLVVNTSRVSPGGGWLEFMSQAGLTGYDNRDVVSGQPDQEVFLYDAVTGGLACVSCDPTGARPAGRNHLDESLVGADKVFTEAWVAGNVPGWIPLTQETSLYQPRFLSDSGRLFFDSSDALVAGDVDGVEDVYEYEPAGVGGEAAVCGVGSVSGGVVFKPERLFVGEGGGGGVEGAGCVGLVSAGAGGGESAFLDASESGSDVFFLTGARLSGSDVDSALDVYDAHVCSSGSPCGGGLVVPPVCVSADACRAAPSPQPEVFGAPASATFTGPGNLTYIPSAPVKMPVKCSKNRKLVHGKCVKVKHKHKHKRKRGRANAGKASRRGRKH